MVKFDNQPAALTSIFGQYRSQAKQVRKDDIRKLIRWCESGLTEIRINNPDKNSSPDEAVRSVASFQDFVGWLGKNTGSKQATRKHILDKVQGMNQMSGHVYPAFNGVLAFLRKNPQFLDALKSSQDTSIPNEIISSVTNFIRKYGDEYRGPQGGYWRNYLSKSLGGHQISGGAGNTIVKKCLVLLPIYMQDRGLI